MVPEYLSDLRQLIPRSLYDELEYVADEYENGRDVASLLTALIQDAMDFIEENQSIPSVRPKHTPSGTISVLNDDDDEYGNDFTLSSEPVENVFAENYFDLEQEPEVYRADTPLEQKGRVNAPMFLERWSDFLIDGDLKTVGVDIARYGDDRTCIVVQHGGHVIDIQTYWKEDNNEVCGHIMGVLHDHSPVSELIVDGTGGWGSTLFDRLRELNVEALTIMTMVVFNASPREEKYGAANARAEMFLRLQERFRMGLITLPNDKDLVEELSWIKFHYRSDGKILLEEKDRFKSAHKRSPDKADALALAFYYSGGLEIY